MHFLIDADLPRPVRDLLRHYGHEATDVRDIGMRSSVDSTIAQYGFSVVTEKFLALRGCSSRLPERP